MKELERRAGRAASQAQKQRERKKKQKEKKRAAAQAVALEQQSQSQPAGTGESATTQPVAGGGSSAAGGGGKRGGQRVHPAARVVGLITEASTRAIAGVAYGKMVRQIPTCGTEIEVVMPRGSNAHHLTHYQMGEAIERLMEAGEVDLLLGVAELVTQYDRNTTPQPPPQPSSGPMSMDDLIARGL